jgi:hypothetical protein
MGYCCTDRCFNTPHAWQAGWLTVRQLNGSSLPAGQTVSLELSSQGLVAQSGARIVPSWAAGVDPLFLGYRTATGIDANLGSLAGKVHCYSAAIQNTYDASPTTWLASLSGGVQRMHASALVLVGG